MDEAVRRSFLDWPQQLHVLTTIVRGVPRYRRDDGEGAAGGAGGVAAGGGGMPGGRRRG